MIQKVLVPSYRKQIMDNVVHVAYQQDLWSAPAPHASDDSDTAQPQPPVCPLPQCMAPLND